MIERVSLPNQSMTENKVASAATGVDVGQQFKNVLDSAISDLNQQNKVTDQLTTQLMTGDLNDIHKLMIENEKAAIHLELAVQVRNKVIEAYQEIMRMQI